MAAVQRDIELRPHVAIDRAGREVVFRQDQIFLNGMRVGYVGHDPGTPICLIRPADADTKAAIEAAVQNKFGEKPKAIHTAPVIQQRDDDE